MPKPHVLIESWLPIDAIGAESKRERGASSALPPLYFLHVWWARRPLIACRAAILAGVLPAWSADFPEDLQARFPNEESYHQWFLEFCGIHGDPVKAQKLVNWAKGQGKSIPNPYEGDRAFKVNPSADDIFIMEKLLKHTWGKKNLSVLDPFAGGGSIPFEALRYGFTTFANDLNPVASVILKATLDYPARFGVSLADDIRKWGNRWYELAREKLQPYFAPLPVGVQGAAYLWARTVQWQGKTIPLSPNWWLSKGDKLVAVKVIAEENSDIPSFEIVEGTKAKAVKPDVGTISHGIGRSPWTGETIDGDYIKAEAQAGRIGQILYAVALKKSGGFEFRASTDEDDVALRNVNDSIDKLKNKWLAQGIIPTESFPHGNDNRPITYGMPLWSDFFSPRQLLVIGFYMETLKEIEKEIRDTHDVEKSNAIMTYLGIALDKCPDYNSKSAVWHPTRTVMAHAFKRHDFSYSWSFGEFDGAGNLLPWAIGQVEDAYKEIAKLQSPPQTSYLDKNKDLDLSISLKVTNKSASNLSNIQTGIISNITVDPPYYDNVQYAELADFFYVWLKRSVGHLFPDFFTDELTNKDDETVANPARFESLGKKKGQLAEQDYENKMEASFREMYRVLHPDGVLTVMFTHKRIEAWDTLASALIGAGFTIKASWPIHTESEHSLHQAKKNAASSTILLVCRKRNNEDNQAVWWDDIKDKVREEARSKATEFAKQGIQGVDLYISTFGPTLSIISENYPVYTSGVDVSTGKPKLLRPETALDLAREEVVRLRKQGLLAGREVQFDPITDWYLMAWDSFKAEEFPYDEARKLALALGIELDSEIITRKRLVSKKSSSVVIQQPKIRRKNGMVDNEMTSFVCWVDAVHTAMMVYEEDGAGACNVFLMKSGLKQDATFIACLQSMINAIPRSRIKGKFVRPEAETLENMRLAFFTDLTVPIDEEPEMPVEIQSTFLEREELEEEEQEE